MRIKYTKQEIIKEFKGLFSGELERLKNDIPAKRELWNNYTDSLCKDGWITENQYNNWTGIY